MMWQPITADEGDFMLAATDWERWRNVIPHPHLYVHSLQAMFTIFGASVSAARAVNLIANSLTALLLVLLVWAAYRDQLTGGALRRAQLITLALWVLSPFVVQNTMLIDIDNGLLATTVVLALLAWLGLRDQPSSLRVLATSGAIALALWTKLTTPPLLMAALVLFYLFRRSWREMGLAIAASLLGIGWFVVTHAVYSQFTGYTLHDAAAAFWWRSGSEGSILASIPTIAAQATGVIVFWITVPLTLLALAAAWQTAANLIRGKLQDADLLMFFVAAVAIFYGLIVVPPWGYPRYHTPGYAVLCVILGGYIAGKVSFTPRRTLAALGAVTLVIALVQLFWVGDPLYTIYRATFETTSVTTRLQASGAPLIKLFLLLLLSIGGMWLLMRSTSPSRNATMIVGLLAAVFGSFLATNLVQITADYSTRYRYTYRFADRQQAIDHVRANVSENGYLLADRDVLWYTDRAGELVYPYMATQALQERLQASHVDALVWTEKEWLKSSLRVDPAGELLLARCFDVKSFGIFTVALRNDAVCSEFRHGSF